MEIRQACFAYLDYVGKAPDLWPPLSYSGFCQLCVPPRFVYFPTISATLLASLVAPTVLLKMEVLEKASRMILSEEDLHIS
eukprot:9224446-Heterocapsa_arctica.AAC.1